MRRAILSICLVYRTSAPPNREELLGALIVHTDLLRKKLLDQWVDEED